MSETAIPCHEHGEQDGRFSGAERIGDSRLDNLIWDIEILRASDGTALAKEMERDYLPNYPIRLVRSRREALQPEIEAQIRKAEIDAVRAFMWRIDDSYGPGSGEDMHTILLKMNEDCSPEAIRIVRLERQLARQSLRTGQAQ